MSKHKGSTFDSFLDEHGLKEEAHVGAVKRVIAWQLTQAMESGGITKQEMAKRMATSRTQLDRLLDPANDKVQLDTIEKAARAVGRRLIIDLA